MPIYSLPSQFFGIEPAENRLGIFIHSKMQPKLQAKAVTFTINSIVCSEAWKSILVRLLELLEGSDSLQDASYGIIIDNDSKLYACNYTPFRL